jgi:hypothetical protein
VIENPFAQGTNFIFSLQTVSNQSYVVEYNNALTNGAWTHGQSFVGDGALRLVTNALTGAQGYYRLASP